MSFRFAKLALILALNLSALSISPHARAQDVAADESVGADQATSADDGAEPAPLSASTEQAPTGVPPERQGTIRDFGPHERPFGLSAMAYIPWYYGIGIGINPRFEIPIVKNGFISRLNNQVSIEPSFALSYTSWYAVSDIHVISATPAVYGTWSFFFSPKFRVYGGIGLGYEFGSVRDNKTKVHVDSNYLFWESVVGLFYNFSDHAAFRAELGVRGPKAGLSVFF